MSNDLDINITELKPALAPVKVVEYPYTELSGISFDAPAVSFWDGDKKLIQYEDAVLFTHKDFSGPGILNISKYTSAGCQMKINYVYPLNYEDVLSRLKEATAKSKADMNNILASEFDLPKRFCQNLVSRYGEGLKALAKALTNETFAVTSVAGFNKAMATSGGIELSQVKLQTMEFKSYPGLFAIGECLDVDGMTGGYNLQFCYSSARACGLRVIELLK
jgi:predicted Rossmann fold flavoprotein